MGIVHRRVTYKLYPSAKQADAMERACDLHRALSNATAALAASHAVIITEDLMIKNMTASAKGTMEEPGKNVRQKAGLNRAILDTSPGTGCPF